MENYKLQKQLEELGVELTPASNKQALKERTEYVIDLIKKLRKT